MAVRWYKENLPEICFRPDLGTLRTGWVPFKSEWALSASKFWVYASGRRAPEGITPNQGFYFTVAGFDGQSTCLAAEVVSGQVGNGGITIPFDAPTFDPLNMLHMVSSNENGAVYRGDRLIELDHLEQQNGGPYPVMAIQFTALDGPSYPDVTDSTYPNPYPLWCTATILYKIED